MNFKKFISGVSAFAIAASAFAGMAVTANAAQRVATVYTSNGGSVVSTSSSGTTKTVDISGGLENATTDVVRVSFKLTTTVDFGSGSGREATATITGKDSNENDITLYFNQ